MSAVREKRPQALSHYQLTRALARAGAEVIPSTHEEIQRDLDTYRTGALRLVLRDGCVLDAYTSHRLSERQLSVLVRWVRQREKRYFRAGEVIKT